MGSCQSWLHRHKAGGGPEEPKGLSFKVLGRAEMRTTAHRFPPGSSRWEQQLAATRASPPPLSLSTWFIPVGAATGSYPLRRSALQFLHRVDNRIDDPTRCDQLPSSDAIA